IRYRQRQRIEHRLREQQQWHDCQRRDHQDHAESPHARRHHRVAAAGEITERQRQHENRDDRAPYIDAATEGRREQPAAEQLHGHHKKARPTRNQIRQTGSHRSPPPPNAYPKMACPKMACPRNHPPRCVAAASHRTLARSNSSVQSSPVNTQELTEIHQALLAVHDTVGTLTFPRCDQEDVLELIDRVETELSASHPNVQIIDTFLNSIARSLRAQPESREACLSLADRLDRTGLPSTSQAGMR